MLMVWLSGVTKVLCFQTLFSRFFFCVIAFVLVSDVFGVLHAADFAVVES